MSRRVIWSPAAKQDLKDLKKYISSKNRQAAEQIPRSRAFGFGRFLNSKTTCYSIDRLKKALRSWELSTVREISAGCLGSNCCAYSFSSLGFHFFLPESWYAPAPISAVIREEQNGQKHSAWDNFIR
jgi:hypothetical protein